MNSEWAGSLCTESIDLTKSYLPLFSFNSFSWSLSSFRARSEFGPAAFKFALSSTNLDSQSRWAACVFSICSAASPLSFDISASWVRISFSWSDTSFGMDPILFARAAGKKTCHSIIIKLEKQNVSRKIYYFNSMLLIASILLIHIYELFDVFLNYRDFFL